MIRGIGVDLCPFSRLEGKSEAFFSRLLSDKEMEKELNAEYVSSRFAAKEALSKALGTGLKGFSLKEVTVVEEEDGRPYFILSGRAKEAAEGLILHLSLSHDGGFSVAIVVAEYEK